MCPKITLSFLAGPFLSLALPLASGSPFPLVFRVALLFHWAVAACLSFMALHSLAAIHLLCNWSPPGRSAALHRARMDAYPVRSSAEDHAAAVALAAFCRAAAAALSGCAADAATEAALAAALATPATTSLPSPPAFAPAPTPAAGPLMARLSLLATLAPAVLGLLAAIMRAFDAASAAPRLKEKSRLVVLEGACGLAASLDAAASVACAAALGPPLEPSPSPPSPQLPPCPPQLTAKEVARELSAAAGAALRDYLLAPVLLHLRAAAAQLAALPTEVAAASAVALPSGAAAAAAAAVAQRGASVEAAIGQLATVLGHVCGPCPGGARISGSPSPLASCIGDSIVPASTALLELWLRASSSASDGMGSDGFGAADGAAVLLRQRVAAACARWQAQLACGLCTALCAAVGSLQKRCSGNGGGACGGDKAGGSGIGRSGVRGAQAAAAAVVPVAVAQSGDAIACVAVLRLGEQSHAPLLAR